MPSLPSINLTLAIAVESKTIPVLSKFTGFLYLVPNISTRIVESSRILYDILVVRWTDVIGFYYVSLLKTFHHPGMSYKPSSLLLFAERLNVAKCSWTTTKLGIWIWYVASHHSVTSFFKDHFISFWLDFEFTHLKLPYIFFHV